MQTVLPCSLKQSEHACEEQTLLPREVAPLFMHPHILGIGQLPREVAPLFMHPHILGFGQSTEGHRDGFECATQAILKG